METARHSAQRSADPVMHLAAVAPPTNAETALGATATFLLSEEGRKASLLAGGNGRAVQDVSVRVPPNRLHLVSVDKLGVARLKLRPRFELDAENRVIRIESAPTYDVPPTSTTCSAPPRATTSSSARTWGRGRPLEPGSVTPKQEYRRADRGRRFSPTDATRASYTRLQRRIAAAS